MSTTVSYKGNTIATINNTTKTLTTEGTWLEDDITITDVTASPSLQSKTNINPTTSSQTITADAGYDGLSSVQINAMPSGSATTPATTITANPSITVSSGGLITATASATQSVTPTVSAGYVSSGTAGTITVSGSNTSQMTTKGATTYTPTTADQTIASGTYLTGTQTIEGDADLVAGNIKSGVSIFGVTGTYSGGGFVEADENDVIFYDYDGTRLYSYSASDFANLSALPANPSHTGLTAQGWNWTLADAKSYVSTYGYINIGQMYDVTDEKTHMFVEIANGTESLPFYLAVKSSVANAGTISWGDGNTETFTTSGGKTHTYSAPGNYEVTIDVSSGTYGNTSTSTSLLGSTSIVSSTNAINTTRVKSMWIGKRFALTNNMFQYFRSMESVVVPKTIASGSGSNYIFDHADSLRHVTFPSTMTAIGTYVCRYNYALKSVSIPKEVTSIGTYAFSYCAGLARAYLPPNLTTVPSYCFRESFTHQVIVPSSATTIETYAFYQNYGGLKSVTIPVGVTTIGNYAFSTLYPVLEYHVKPTSPPTISSSTFANINSNCKIYVPTASLSTYQGANNWSAQSSKMVGE